LMAERKHGNHGSYLDLGPCRISLGYGCPGCADPGACNFREHAGDRSAAPRPFPKSRENPWTSTAWQFCQRCVGRTTWTLADSFQSFPLPYTNSQVESP
jgi:hypothetical protein